MERSLAERMDSPSAEEEKLTVARRMIIATLKTSGSLAIRQVLQPNFYNGPRFSQYK